MPGKAVHVHKDDAIKKATPMEIGRIREPLSSMIFKPAKAGAEVDLEKETWKLVNKQMISAVHGRFQFKCDNIKPAGMLPYFDHCGKYYTVRIYFLTDE